MDTVITRVITVCMCNGTRNHEMTVFQNGCVKLVIPVLEGWNLRRTSDGIKHASLCHQYCHCSVELAMCGWNKK